MLFSVCLAAVLGAPHPWKGVPAPAAREKDVLRWSTLSRPEQLSLNWELTFFF